MFIQIFYLISHLHVYRSSLWSGYRSRMWYLLLSVLHGQRLFSYLLLLQVARWCLCGEVSWVLPLVGLPLREHFVAILWIIQEIYLRHLLCRTICRYFQAYFQDISFDLAIWSTTYFFGCLDIISQGLPEQLLVLFVYATS